jgi:hypothetical protein
MQGAFLCGEEAKIIDFFLKGIYMLKVNGEENCKQ